MRGGQACGGARRNGIDGFDRIGHNLRMNKRTYLARLTLAATLLVSGCAADPASAPPATADTAQTGDAGTVDTPNSDASSSDSASADASAADTGGGDATANGDVTLSPGTLGPPKATALRTAYVSANSFSLAGDDKGAQTVVAQFIDQDPSPLSTTTETIGPCIVRTSESAAGGGFPKYFSAGDITITGGYSDVVLKVTSKGWYDAFQSSTKALSKPGATLTFTALGAQVGGFIATLTAPGHVLITQPQWFSGTTHTLARDKPVELLWTGTSAGDVEFVLQGPQVADKPRIHATCAFAANDGKGTIPAAVVAKMDADTNGLLSANVVSQTTVKAGQFGDVLLRADARALGNKGGNSYGLKVLFK